MSLLHYVLFFLGHLLPRVASAVALAIYTRHLSAEQYGAYSLAMAWVVMPLIVGLYWLQPSLSRLLPDQSTREAQARLVGTTVLTGLGIVVGLLPVAAGLASTVDRGFAIAAAASWVAQGGFVLVHTTTIARQESRAFMWLSCLDAFIKVSIGAWVVRRGMGPTWLLGLPAISGVLVFAIQIARLRAGRGLELVLDRRALREMAAIGLPMIPVWAGAYALTSLDKYLFVVLSTRRELGLYAAAYPLGDALVQSVTTPLLLAFGPRLFATAATDGHEAASQQLSTLLDGATWIVCGIVACGAAAGAALARLFLGAEFRGSGHIIPWIATGLAFWTLGSLAAKQLEIDKRTSAGVRPMLIAAAINAVANVVLLPRFGAMGAAYATVLGYFAYFVLVSGAAQRNAVRLLLKRWRSMAAGVTAGLVAARLAGRLGGGPFLAAAAVGLLTAVIYVAISLLLREPPAVGYLGAVLTRLARRARKSHSLVE